MNSSLLHTINNKTEQGQVYPIGVSILDIPEEHASKIRNILKLSENRTRKYAFVEDNNSNQSSVLISDNPDQTAKSHQTIVYFGNSTDPSKYSIKPPLLSIRVLRVLDGIDIKPVNRQNRSTTEQQHLQDQSTPKAVHSTKSNNDTSSNQSITETTNNQDVKAYRILIVDDSMLIHKALEIELDKAPFNSDRNFALSGEECLQQVSENQFDIIFLDVMMPGIDGFETCSQIRKLAQYKKTPIIMLSAKTSPLDEVKGVMAGCTTYLTKPIVHEEFYKLLGRMGNWLENFKTN
ncbi:MAG: response regulator [Gammaproteobacteria bacterium]|nr:response regulator [Gammaproteobacteria bacterium]